MTLLLAGARVRGHGGVVDVLLADGRIAALGPGGSVEAGHAERVDVDGRIVAPGMWDAHVHLTQFTVQRRRFDLAPARSAAETLELVRAELVRRRPAPDEVVVGYGFRDGTWPDATTRAAIDAIGAAHPIALVSGDLHCAWINTAAAVRLGVEPDESGLVREGPWIEAMPRLGEVDALTPADYRDAQAEAARRGVVGVLEFEHADNQTEWPARVAAGADLLRVETSVWPDRLDDVVAAGHRTGDILDERGLVTMGPLKVVVDGSLNTRTALCWDPYPDLPAGHPHRCGIASVPVDELRDLMRRARDAGIDAAIHAIGDRANSEVLDVFAELGMPGAIEHAQLVAEADFARFAELGVVAGIQPEHAMDDRDVADHHWAERTGRAFAYGSLHRAGAGLRMGSDAPVAPLDPWRTIAAATSRRRDGREPWHPEQALPFEVAYAASIRSRVAAGEPADLVVLDADPAALSDDDLRDLPVAATLLGGRFTHRAF